MSRTFALISVACACLGFPAIGMAQQGGVQVETITGHTETADDIETARIIAVREGRRRQPPTQVVVVPVPDSVIIHELPEPVVVEHRYYNDHQGSSISEPDYEIMGVGHVAAWIDFGRIDGSSEAFSDPEIAALEGLAPAREGSDWDLTAGGIMLGIGLQPHDWLRVPELRLYVGGGEVRGGTQAVTEDLSVSPDSVFTVGLEVAAGIQHKLGSLTPYLVGRAGFSANFVTVDVQHTQLGDLGSELLVNAQGELGLEAGASLAFSDEFHLTGAYRYTPVGRRGSGFLIGFTAIAP